MGMYQELHFGWYFIANERVIEDTEMVRVCSNDIGHGIAEGGYCPDCGSEVVDRPKLKSTSLDIYDFEEMGDQFIFPEFYVNNTEGMILGISNYGAGCMRLEDSEIINFNDIEYTKQKLYQEFMQKHESDIEFLKEHLYDNLQVNFGMFFYYM